MLVLLENTTFGNPKHTYVPTLYLQIQLCVVMRSFPKLLMKILVIYE